MVPSTLFFSCQFPWEKGQPAKVVKNAPSGGRGGVREANRTRPTPQAGCLTGRANSQQQHMDSDPAARTRAIDPSQPCPPHQSMPCRTREKSMAQCMPVLQLARHWVQMGLVSCVPQPPLRIM